MNDSTTTAPDGGVNLDEPIDAEFQEAPADPPARPGKRGPGWFSTLFIALLATGGGGVLGYGASELQPGLLSGFIDAPDAALVDLSGLEQADSDLGETLDAFEVRLARAESSLTARPTGPSEADLAQLAGRLDTLEAVTIDSDDGTVAPEQLQRAVAAATNRITALETALDSLTDTPDPALADMRASISSLSSDLNAIAGRIDMLEAEIDTRIGGATSRSAALADAALALSAIDAAARRGEGFAPSLAALKRLRPGNAMLAELEPFAIDGAPTLSQLEDDLAALRPDLRAALSPPAPEGGAGGLASRLFGDAIEVRRDGDVAASAAVDDAAAALESGDLGAAITALETLDGEAANIAAPWLASAGARRTLERTLDGLRLDLMAEDR